jgi:hypothetical protein
MNAFHRDKNHGIRWVPGFLSGVKIFIQCAGFIYNFAVEPRWQVDSFTKQKEFEQ